MTGALATNTTYTLTCAGAGGTSPATSVTVNIVPTATLAANPVSIAPGGTTTLTWNSTNATACMASGAWTGAQAASGTYTSAALTVSTVFSLVCSGAGGNSDTVSADVTIATAPSAPTATLSATPTTVAPGATTTLTWSSTNANSCSLSDGTTQSVVADSGSNASAALTATTTFTLTCSGAGGRLASTPVTVTVTGGGVRAAAPVVTLTAAPSTVVSGGRSTLTWSSSNAATACMASGAWAGAQATAGSFLTAAVTATATYSLTCSNAAGTSPLASVTVTVGTATTTALSPKIAAITLTRSQQFTSTLPGTTTTWTVNGVVGGTATTGTISSAGLYTAGTAPGLYNITATSGTDATKSALGTVAVTDLTGIYSYHNDLARDGANLQEYALTTANVATDFGKLGSCQVDGAVYAQPLWVANVTIGGAKHNVLYVATEHDGLFAFDADPVGNACVKLWSVNLIDAAHGGVAGESTVPNGPTVTPPLIGNGDGDLQPEVGVTGTPVIDPATNILYVVTKSVVLGTANTFYQRLHAVDITSGAEKAGSPIVISGSYTPAGGTAVTFDSQQHLQRTGLTFANGNVYVAFSAHEDKGPGYGWMMSYNYSGTAFNQKNIINVAPVAGKAGIWMSGGAPAADASGNIYFITGNGPFDVNSGGTNYGNSMMKLSPTLGILGYYTPSTEVANSLLDRDLGAGGAAIMADLPEGNTVRHAMIFGGKESRLFVADRDNPGGYDANDSLRIQEIAFGDAIFATAALWNNHLYLAGNAGHLKSFSLDTASAQFTFTGQSVGTYGFPGATPSVSSAGTANGVVWTLDTGGAYCTNQAKANAVGSKCSPGVLHAHDAGNLATELWNSSKTAADTAGYPIKFNVVTVANGHAYIGTRGTDCSQNCAPGVVPTILGTVDVYGLKP